MDLEQIRQLILDLGAYRAGLVAVEDIDFQPDFRKLCESNACGMYGRSWMCPPLVGEVDQLIASLKRWRWAVIYQTVDALEDSYDFEGMMAAGEKMNRLTARIRGGRGDAGFAHGAPSWTASPVGPRSRPSPAWKPMGSTSPSWPPRRV